MAEPKKETMVNNLLTLDIEDNGQEVNITWLGKSVDREPGQFITPILADVLKGGKRDKKIILDFRNLDYMNSSTITPVIKALDRAHRGAASMLVIYDKKKKWQDLNFSALRIFETEDERVRIKGL